MMMLICNEGKDDKKYHIAYQLNTVSPVIPYCRMVGHLDVAVQVQSDNPKICEKCKKVAGIGSLESVPMPVEELRRAPSGETKAIAALTRLRRVSGENTYEGQWWRQRIREECEAAGIDEGDQACES
jgi:hypothetical protein